MIDFDSILLKYLPKKQNSAICSAMEYSLFPGGKRLRPRILYERALSLGLNDRSEGVELFCAAIEYLHTYSLIHDDLPCMDDDDMRRGKPSCHVKFGYSTAVLTGDALLNLAFETLAEPQTKGSQYIQAIGFFADRSGINGMIGGQEEDVARAQNAKKWTLDEYLSVVEGKTSALFQIAMCVPPILCGKDCRSDKEYAKLFGYLFQIADDLDDECPLILTIIDKQSCLTFVQDLFEQMKRLQTILGLSDNGFFNEINDKLYGKILQSLA